MSEDINSLYVRKDIHDKDQEITATEIRNLNARLDDVKGFIGWGFALLGLAFVVAQVAIGYFIYLMTITPK